MLFVALIAGAITLVRAGEKQFIYDRTAFDQTGYGWYYRVCLTGKF